MASEIDGELRRTVDRHGWRLDALDRWRDRSDARMTTVENRLNELDRAAAIARAVAREETRKANRARSSRYSRGELVVGGVVAFCAVGGLVFDVVRATGHG